MALQTIPITITALAPLAFPERKPGVQFNASLPYVPGAAIYGAVGAALQQQGRFDEALLRELRCHNAYPARAGDAWVRPLPATAIAPKGSDDDTLPRDSLYERVCWEIQQPAALIYAPTDPDGRPWEAAGAKFYSLQGGKPYRSVAQRVLTRVAISRSRGTAEDQRFFSPLVLSEVTDQAPTVFRGSVTAPAETIGNLRSTLEQISYLGGRQTTGLGAVQIEALPDGQAAAAAAPGEPAAAPTTAGADTADALRERVARMTARFQRQAALYAGLGGTAWRPDDTTIFTVNLLADAILFEEGWLPTQEFSAQQLCEATGIEAELLRAFTTTRTVGGWQVLWQRPKATDVATVMGGLFVFAARRPLDDAAATRLLVLQSQGIGERRPEGFGQIRICDDFHLVERKEQSR